MLHHIFLKTSLLTKDGHDWLRKQCNRTIYSVAHVLSLLDNEKFMPLNCSEEEIYTRYKNADDSLTHKDVIAIDDLFNNVRLLLGTAWFDNKYSPSRHTSKETSVDDWLDAAYDTMKKEANNESFLKDYINHAMQEPTSKEDLFDNNTDDAKSFGQIVKDVISNLWEEPPHSPHNTNSN